MHLIDFSNQWRDTLSSSGDSIYWRLQRDYKRLKIVLQHYGVCNEKMDSMKVLILEDHYVLSRSYGKTPRWLVTFWKSSFFMTGFNYGA